MVPNRHKVTVPQASARPIVEEVLNKVHAVVLAISKVVCLVLLGHEMPEQRLRCVDLLVQCVNCSCVVRDTLQPCKVYRIAFSSLSQYKVSVPMVLIILSPSILVPVFLPERERHDIGGLGRTRFNREALGRQNNDCRRGRQIGCIVSKYRGKNERQRAVVVARGCLITVQRYPRGVVPTGSSLAAVSNAHVPVPDTTWPGERRPTELHVT